MLPQQLQVLINQFTRLPGIGPRQAARFVFYLLRNNEEISALSDTLKSVGESIGLCRNCFLPSYASPACAICISPKRDKNTICVVEKETDALNLEKNGHFQGHYFVLGGFIDPLNKESVAYERLSLLVDKIQNGRGLTPQAAGSDPDNLEIILALAPRREGDFTSLYIEEQLKPLREQGLKVKTTRLGRGLSSGAELEYADEETLKNALEGRR
jgi:recombination protein RecR